MYKIGGQGIMRRCGGEVICRKNVSTVFSESKFGPPNEKIPGSAPAQPSQSLKDGRLQELKTDKSPI